MLKKIIILEKHCSLKFLQIFTFFLLVSCKKDKVTVPNNDGNDSLDFFLTIADKTIISHEEKLLVNNKAYLILRGRDNDSLNREKLFQIATNFFFLNDWPSFKKTSEYGLEMAKKGEDSAAIAKGYRYIAQYYNNANVIDSAFFFYREAEKLYIKLNDKSNLGKVLLKKGILQFYVNDYFGADISTSHAYNLLKDSDDKHSIYQAVSMIAIVANEMKDFSRAIEKHEEALEMVRQYNLNNNSQEATTLNNIGNVYQNLNRNEEAIQNFKLALKEPNLRFVNPDLYAILLDNMAYSKFKLNDDSNLPHLFYEALKIRDSLKNRSGIILSKIHLSEFFAYKNDTIKSQEFAKQATFLAKQIKAPGDMLAALKQLSLVDHRKASRYSKEYIRINDSLQQAERKSQNKLARIQYETDEILEEKDQLAEQNRSLLYFFIATLMIGMLLFIIRAQRAKNRELLLKQAQQKANEDIYNLMITQQNTIEESRIREKKRIAQELHDGVLGRLFGARLNLDSLNKMSSENAVSKRNDYLTELKNIEQDIREISHDLNREKFALINNFIAILNNLLEEQKSSFESKLYVEIDDTIVWDDLNNTSKINLYRIIQESLQNINKYASATSIKLEIKKSENSLVVNIIDNGVGFTVSSKKKGIGLQNIISRTHEINGICDIKSKKGKGTTIQVAVPITYNV